MKYFLILLFIAGHGLAISQDIQAENWNGWQQYKKNNPKEKFCPPEQEAGLLELLAELDRPSPQIQTKGRESEVRRKYRIARKLRAYDDCRAEEALKKLLDENACEDMGEGEVFCVKWGASASLQEISSKKDLKKLTPETPLAEQLTIFKKYGQHPHENDFASHEVMNFLLAQADTNPEVYIPLLVEYFTQCHEILEIVKKYPQAATIGLRRCLLSPESTVVWAGINLARTLEKKELLAEVYEVSFAQKGMLDYSQQEDIEEIQANAIAFFRLFESESIPYYRGILFGGSTRGKEYVVSGIRNYSNPELLILFQEFASFLQETTDGNTSLLLKRLEKQIVTMKDRQK